MIRVLTVWVLPVVLAAVGACSRPPDTTPPQVRYGEVECATCRMLVSDERFAAALVFESDRDVTKLVFDDINCAFRYLSDHPVAEQAKLYAHDVDTRTWLDARAAIFVHSPALETPMASQIAAASSREAAERLRERCPGELLTFEDVARLFTPARPVSAVSEGEAASL